MLLFASLTHAVYKAEARLMDGEKHPILRIRALIHRYTLFLALCRENRWIQRVAVLPLCRGRDEEVRATGNVLEEQVSVLGQRPFALLENLAPTVSAIDRPRESR